ncbi:MAG: 23S rRNA (pseudouridine(1915)-N(3))-methyltransferase RlmH [Firmicutes bacterium]|nr:23S rRNA (pseudouridine(1915)-N(3))-methyltransferase RlmH [Bacillota bacterium]
MKKINIICAGKLKEKFFKDAFLEYEKRLSRFCKLNVVEVNDYPDDMNSIEKEATLMLPYLKNFSISLDINGKNLSSEEFSSSIDKAFITNSEVNFFIGGSHGLSNEIKQKSNLNLSFGKLTYPHQLMRVMLVEQIYRAFSITTNTKYHK